MTDKVSDTHGIWERAYKGSVVGIDERKRVGSNVFEGCNSFFGEKECSSLFQMYFLKQMGLPC